MKTRVLTVDAVQPASTAMVDAAAVLTHGGLVAFPTETVYGLGADALSERAVARIFDVKGRPTSDPVIVHVASVDDLPQIAKRIPAAVGMLAERFWPGPLTLVLEKHGRVPDLITAGLRTVGVRVPSHPVAQALLLAARLPIAAPSANRFSRPSPTTAQHVLDDLGGAIDLVLDAGPAPIGVESTVLDLTTSPPLVRRPGGVTVEALQALLGDLEVRSERVLGGTQLAPGQLLRHYAPRAKVTYFVGDAAAVSHRIASDARQRVAAGGLVGILGPEEDLLAMAPAIAAAAASGRIRTARFGSRRDPARAARELFAALRALDAEDVDEILASAPAPRDIGLAIHDRLTRAAEGRVVRV